MHFISEKLDDYVISHSQEEPELLQELSRETWRKVLAPRMLSGHFQGRVLSMISKLINPKNILEIGTYTGYSALCLAEGMQSKGKLHTIDTNEELEDFVNEYVAKSKFKNQIKCVIGNAIELIPEMDEQFDLVFIDADKSNYINYYNMAMTKLSPGGYIIIDNVLWSGKVLEPVDPNDLDTKVLVDLNNIVHEDSRVQEVLLPVRDGLLVIRKK